jgi:esterase/lipase superfamily enzyme
MSKICRLAAATLALFCAAFVTQNAMAAHPLFEGLAAVEAECAEAEPLQRDACVLGLRQLRGGQPDLAAATLQSISEGGALFARAVALYKIEDCESAIQDFARVREMDPQDAIAALGHGLCSLSLKQHRDALESLNEAVRLLPESAHTQQTLGAAHFAVGAALFHLGPSHEAMTHFEMSEQAGWQSAELDLYRGNVKLGEGQHAVALEYFERAIAADAAHVEPLASFYAGIAAADANLSETRVIGTLARAKQYGVRTPWEEIAREAIVRLGYDADELVPIWLDEGDPDPDRRLILFPARLYVPNDVGAGPGQPWFRRSRALEPRSLVVPVRYATDRKLDESADKIAFLGERVCQPNGVCSSELHYGVANVSIPADHRVGSVERPSFWQSADKEKHFMMSIRVQTKDQYFDGLKGGGEILVFIHGFNVGFEDAVFRTAQMSYDLEFHGKTVLYSWPSADSLGAYMTDRSTAQDSRHLFAPFLERILADSGASVVHVIAHSMGNEVLVGAMELIDLEKIQGGSSLRNIVFAAPDVSAQNFNQFAKRFRETHPKEPRMTLYASSDDKALAFSAIPNGVVRAGFFEDTDTPNVIADGVDTIDASGIDTTFLQHSYYGDNTSVLADLLYVLCGWPPEYRDRLVAKTDAAARPYYEFKRGNAVGNAFRRLFPDDESPWRRCGQGPEETRALRSAQ